MRKKLSGLLAVLVCLLMLSACGGTASGETQEIDEETRNGLYSLTESTIQSMDEVVNSGLIEEQKSNKAVYEGLQSWEKAKADTGAIDFTTDADGNGLADCFTEKSISIDDDNNYIVTVEVAGASKSADFVATFNEDLTDYISLVTNVNYSSKELIQQAGMNTLLGMGTTFSVLILLSLIIALFGKIFTAQAKRKAEEAARKDQEEAEKRAAAAESAGSAAAPAGQGALAQQTDDGALIAVIAAAVAAYRAQEDPAAALSGDPDAFVVRRIRRIRRK